MLLKIGRRTFGAPLALVGSPYYLPRVAILILTPTLLWTSLVTITAVVGWTLVTILFRMGVMLGIIVWLAIAHRM